ncbi:MAG TPA: GtrA family protein [Candidatus Paceibacterota bacterium]|nr:GtrA family protein [Candidatus Paceibacterota bacterium]
MTRKDLWASIIIGAAVGLLVQPIMANLLSGRSLGFADRAGAFVFFILFAPFALWLCWLIAKAWKGFYQFGKFAAVGTLNSFVDVGVFNLETFFYGTSLIGNLLFAVFKTVSFLCATTNSFAWNKYWTFSAREKPRTGEVASFYGVAIAGWAINVGVATLAKALGPADSKAWVDLVAPVCGIAASFLWDFFGYKYFVFRKREPLQSAA